MIKMFNSIFTPRPNVFGLQPIKSAAVSIDGMLLAPLHDDYLY